MAIIMGKGCLEAIYGLMGWKGLIIYCEVCIVLTIYRHSTESFNK